MTTADCDAVIVGSGPGGSTVADVLTAAAWSVVVLEKGRNHLVDLAPSHDLLRHFANDEVAATRRHLLGPDPRLEPRTYRRSPADGDRLLTGEVNNLPSTGPRAERSRKSSSRNRGSLASACTPPPPTVDGRLLTSPVSSRSPSAGDRR